MQLIKGFDDYSITKDGQVFSHKTNKLKKPFMLITGYIGIQLYKDNKKKNYSVHRLVAETYLINFESKMQVNHIDGNKINNHISNLEWVTPKENMKHALDNGLRKKYYPKCVTYKLVLDTLTGIFYNDIKEASKYSNYNYRYLRGMLNGNHKNKTSLVYA
jgi:hypothetical protein